MLTPVHEAVSIPFSGGELRGDLSFAQVPGPWGVLWIHGFGSHRGGEKAQAVEAACSRRGWTFASFDFRGHGRSSGSMRDLRGTSLLDDLDLIRGYLQERGVTRLGYVGSSMGGWASAWSALRAGREAVPACVWLAPALRFLQARWEQLTPEQREEWRRSGVISARSEWVTAEIGYGLAEERDLFPTGRLAAEWDRPVLIFHGLADSVIPPSVSLSFVELTTCQQVEVRLFKDGDHRLTAYKDEIAEETCRFFERFA